ncbi:MAG: ribose 5-phosphate isomerase B [Candidatus Diapherotrites archaeon]|nr:ribose 5-phosphate isomerase B [Candidatus Diapherotrites archaeon]
MKLAIASDHGGFELKNYIMESLVKEKYDIEDFGCDSAESCDYPDYALKVADAVACGNAEFGILVCGTGIGMSMAANKVRGIRAAVASSAEQAKLAREHNNANVLCIGGRILQKEQAEQIVKTFLTTYFTNEERHLRRVNKIMEIEKLK